MPAAVRNASRYCFSVTIFYGTPEHYENIPYVEQVRTTSRRHIDHVSASPSAMSDPSSKALVRRQPLTANVMLLPSCNPTHVKKIAIESNKLATLKKTRLDAIWIVSLQE